MSGLDRICHARVDPNVLLMYVDKGATVYRTAGVGRLIIISLSQAPLSPQKSVTHDQSYGYPELDMDLIHSWIGLDWIGFDPTTVIPCFLHL